MPDNAGSDRHKPTSLRGIAITAASNKQHRFRNLYGLLNRELLYEGWKRLNKKAASGVDKVTAKEYSQNLFDNLSDLERRLKEKQYKAKLIRRSYISNSVAIIITMAYEGISIRSCAFTGMWRVSASNG